MKQNGNFEDHRTIDAGHLVNLHNAVCRDKLSDEFVTQFNSFRCKRNALMHSVGTRLSIDAIEILRMILFFHHEMFPDERWSRVRQRFVDTEPETVAYASDFVVNNLCGELDMVISVLKPADVKKYFLIEKKVTRYLCSTCHSKANHDYDLRSSLRFSVRR